jgi:hypothetical protein
MILRRLFLLIPGKRQAESVLRDLVVNHVNRRHIHAIAKAGVDTGDLPLATIRQKNDLSMKIEHWAWDANLLLFFIALLVMLAALWTAEWLWVVGCLLVAAATVFLGYRFAGRMPQTHVEDCLTPLRHGEILLLVDIPRWRITDVERNIKRLHPEVEIGGVGWGLDALGI